MSEEIDLNALAQLIAAQSDTFITKTLKKLQKETLNVAKAKGYHEVKIHVPLDPVGVEYIPSEKEIFDSKITYFQEILDENPLLVEKAFDPKEQDKYMKTRVGTSKQARSYRKRQAELKAQAAEILRNIQREPDPLTGKIKRLTPFEKEIIEELKLADEMGIEIPFEFPGKKDKKLEELKLKFRGHDSDSMEKYLNALSAEDLEKFKLISKEILKNVNFTSNIA